MSNGKSALRLLKASLTLILFSISISSLSAATEVYFAQALRGSADSGTSCILIWNPTDAAASVTIRFTNQAGTVQETQVFSVASQATEKRTLGGAGVSLTVGSVKVTSATTGVLATLLFSISGLPEVGVLSVLGNTWWSGVGQVDDEVNTGLAVRATGGPAVCTLTTYRANGSLAGTAPVVLGADDQTAMFLDEMINNLPTPYRGCFSLHCEGDVVAVALRQRRSDGFFTTIAMGNSEGENAAIYAQAVRGSAASGTSRILVWNPGGSPASVTVRLRDQAGTSRESQTTSVPSKATEEITLGGPGVPLTVGSVSVSSAAGILSTLLFNLSGLPTVGVLPNTGNGWWSGVGQVDSDVNTGVAARNTGSPTTCTLTAYRTNGTMAGTEDLNFGTNQQIARFLDELIPGLATPYNGCFSLHCEGGTVAAVALRQQRSDGIFTTIAMSPIPSDGNGGPGTGDGTDLLPRRIDPLSMTTNQTRNVVLPLGSRITGTVQTSGLSLPFLRTGGTPTTSQIVTSVVAECNNEVYPGVTASFGSDFIVVTPTGVPCNLTVSYTETTFALSRDASPQTGTLPTALLLRFTDPTSVSSPGTRNPSLPTTATATASGTINTSNVPAALASFSKSLLFTTGDGRILAFAALDGFGPLSSTGGAHPQGGGALVPYSVDLPRNETYNVGLLFAPGGSSLSTISESVVQGGGGSGTNVASFFVGTLNMGSGSQIANFVAPPVVKVSGTVTQAQTSPKNGFVAFFDTRSSILSATPQSGFLGSVSSLASSGAYDPYVIQGQSYSVFTALTLDENCTWSMPNPFAAPTQTFNADTILNFAFPNFPAENTLSGNVTDPSGAVVPDVDVSVVCTGATGAPNTQLLKDGQTNAQGNYTIPGIFSSGDCSATYTPLPPDAPGGGFPLQVEGEEE